MSKPDSDKNFYNHTPMGFNPKYNKGPEYKPGGGVFGLFITAAIILVIVLVIFLISYDGNITGNDQIETQESTQESVD
ncbi:MAG: hypothetical protein HN948_04610 [Clostridia bacterium]|jgi:uncharacterized membrane protein|nr:hypothetical protein [Clostridia bacterium]MBT7122272.1 hypothetical protein [Clostridia bacterium]